MKALIAELVPIPGLSGYETPAREFIAEKVRPFARVHIDPIGNLSASVGSGYPRMLFASHMDEIGMVVSYIEPDGFLRIRKVGLLDDRLPIGPRGRDHDQHREGTREPLALGPRT